VPNGTSGDWSGRWQHASSTPLPGIADTDQGDVTRLQGVSDAWRLRVGDWRIRLRYDQTTRTLVVLRILPRGQAYR
jgi:mRNA-degrading endonuclease RelE of RelBE toxin-antitoxin system